MNKKLLLGFLTLILFYSCGCQDNETILLELNQFESSLIPNNKEENIQFINQNEEIINARTTDKIVESRNLNSSENDECTTITAQSHENQLVFDTLDRTFTTEIEKRSGNTSHIVVTDFTEFFGIENLNTENLEEVTRDFSSDGFDFDSVFVLNSGNNDSSFIIYSANNQIEFIKNQDGTFLRRLE